MAVTTNVPLPTFTAKGFVPPTQEEILAGIKADLNQAWGTILNFGTLINPTPQGQLAISQTAIIGNAYNMFCTLANAVDPAFAFGRMQDAIGRIYFMSRIPGASTVVACDCVGSAATIPPGALAKDEAGNVYAAITGGTLPPGGGTISLEFANLVQGPIPCPAGQLNFIYRTIPGWDTINNPADGELGTNVETRSSFEARREESVAKNTVGFNPSIRGEVLDVAGVLDAYVIDNYNDFEVGITPVCTINGSIAGTTLTVDSVESGIVAVGQTVTAAAGAAGGLVSGTEITAEIDPTHWTINHSQTAALQELNLGAVVLPPNSLYVAAIGGDSAAVAQAIWRKKAPGCSYYPGNTTVTVYDTNAQLPDPGVPYTVVYEIPPALPFVAAVNLINNPDVPSDAQAQVAAVVVAAFAGTDNLGLRAKIGFPMLASRLYPGIAALGSWAQIASVLLGTTNTPGATVTAAVGASFNGVATGTSLVVTGIGVGQHISAGDTLLGAGVIAPTTIISGPGGDGTYIISQASTINGAATTTSNVLNVTAVAGGTVALRQVLFDAIGNINDGTTVTAFGTGTGGTGTYVLNGDQQRVASETMIAVAANLDVVPVSADQAPTITTNTVQVFLV